MSKLTLYLKDSNHFIMFMIPLSIFLLSGCATVPYKYGQDIEQAKSLKLSLDEPQVERGRPVKFIDFLGHYVFSIPSKLILLDWDVDNHNISIESEFRLKQYLIDNELHHVKVRLNQYAPGAEWRRLFRNRSVGAGWRYTLGIITLIEYTILPGRLLGGDHYNPYTNTINLYSDHKAILLHEAGHAKDFAKRKYKGTYSALGVLPLVPLYQEALATGDAVGYYKEKGLAQEEKDAYKILYPAYGTYMADEVLRWAIWVIDIPLWVDFAFRIVVVIPCHVVGRMMTLTVDESSASKPPAAIESTAPSYEP